MGVFGGRGYSPVTPDQREVIRQHVAGNESIGPIVGALLDEIDRLEAERDQWSANHGKLAGQFLDLKAEHKLEIALLMASRSTPGLGALARDLTKLDLKDAQEQHDLDVAEWAKERRRLEAKVMDLTYQAKCGHSSWPVCDCGYKHPGCGGS